MKRLTTVSRNPWFYLTLSTLMALAMIISLLPGDVLAQGLPTSSPPLQPAPNQLISIPFPQAAVSPLANVSANSTGTETSPTPIPISSPAPTIAPAPTMVAPPISGNFSLVGKIDNTGLVTANITVSSPDNLVSLVVLTGTRILVANGQPLSEIDLTPASGSALPASANTTEVSAVYSLGPTGASFAPPVTMVFSYNASILSNGTDPSQLYIAFYNPASSRWLKLASVVDTVHQKVSAQIGQAGSYALMAAGVTGHANNDSSNRVTVKARPDQATEVVSADKRIKLEIPAGSVSALTDIEMDEVAVPSGSTGMQVLHEFVLKAHDDVTQAAITHFHKNLQISIQNNGSELNGLDEDSLRLYYLDRNTHQWIPLPDNKYNPSQKTLTATTDHFTTFGEIGNSLAVGPGRVLASQVELHSGAASFSYPIDLPPGPGGFKPKLELNYNSGTVDGMKNKQDTASWVGAGWSLHFGRIIYEAKNSPNPNISSASPTDLYYLDLDGLYYQLVSSDGVNYQTNPDQYFKITRSSNTWTLYDRDGNFYRFGGTTDSEQYTGGTSGTYYRWDLSLMQDTNGNQATVSYIQDIWNNSVRAAYPQYLNYDNIQVYFSAGYDINDPTYGYLRNDDPIPYGTTGAMPEVMDDRHLDYITIKAGGALVRQYNFAYDITDKVYSSDYGGIYYAGQDTLTSITQVGSDGSSTLPTMSFGYTNQRIYRDTTGTNGEDPYSGNPGNPATLNWYYLTTINSGYGGSVSFTYTETPANSPKNIWTREIITSKTINPGIGPDQTYTYSYPSGLQYLGKGWDQKYRGFNEVQETDATGNYVVHYYFTTGIIDGKDAERLTGLEYDTQWYDSNGIKLKEKQYDWNWIDTSQYYDTPNIWSGEGKGESFFTSPLEGIAVSSDGSIYLSEWDNDYTNHKIVKFDQHGNCVSSWGTYGSGNGQFSYPEGVAVDSSGNVYVVDRGNYRIQKFTSDGTYLTQWGSYGSGNGQFYTIYGIAVDSNDNVYVVDTGNNRIQKFTSDGTYLAQWGSLGSGNGQFQVPYGIAVDSNNNIYVADCLNHRVEKFTSDGTYISQWGSNGTDNGQFNTAFGVAVDSNNNVYVSDSNNFNIQKFDSSGNYISKWSISAPKAIAASSESLYSSYYLYSQLNFSVTEFIRNWAIQLAEVNEITGSKTSRTRYSYDSYGNVTTENQDGDISTGADDVTITHSYYPNTSANILDKPASEVVSGVSGHKETYYYYDNNNSSNTTPPVKGNLTRVEQKNDPSPSISTYYTYDSYGNKLTEQDPNGNTTSWTYDSTYHAYPASKTYPAVAGGQFSESYSYDPGTNNLLSQTDINGQTTYYFYDPFKRLTEVVKPGDSQTSPTIQYQYNSWGNINQQNIKTIARIDAGNNLWSADYFDGLGRVIQTQNQGNDGHTIISKTTTYNSQGLTDRVYVSQDIASILTAYQSPDVSWKSTSYAYDGLGRVTNTTNPDGTTTSNNYGSAWQTTVTDQDGHQKIDFYDAFQRLVKVEELNDSQQVYATTNYSYDAIGNLLQVEDNNGNVTTMSYDWLSRKTSMIDPDMGNWSYGYDNNGNLTTQTDAKGQTINMVYDALNRLTNKNYPAGSGMTNVSYSYDAWDGSSQFGRGKRTGMNDASGNTSDVYDARGRLTQETRTINSIPYVTSYTYDDTDRTATITYPSGEVVTQTYDSRGLPVTLSGSQVGNLVTGTQYNNLGDMTEIDLGNGLSTYYGYWGYAGTYDNPGGYYGSLYQIKTGSLQDMEYSWDAAGNLTQRQNLVNSETENFSYDFLNRLTGVSGAYSQSYSYNQIGNITSLNSNAYTYGAQPQAATSIGPNSYYSYDPNGNMLSYIEGGPVNNLDLTNGGSGYTTAPAVTISGGGGAGAAATATLDPAAVQSLTLTSGGSGYTSPPTVMITGGNGSGATATVTLSGRSVSSITITNGGSGYTSPPTVTMTGGGGSGAAASAVLEPASIASLTLTNNGSGYTSAPDVTINGGGGSGATATAHLGPAAVGSLNLNNDGSGYTSTPTVTISGGGGSGATATATLAGTSVGSITVTSQGRGYNSTPDVYITGGGGSGAAATATVSHNKVAAITITNGGSGYTSIPAVTISGGGGSGATAGATLATASVGSLTITNGGFGYTSAPTVTISGGGGSGAEATTTLGPAAISSLTLTSTGSGYTSAPSVSITGGGGSGASATANLSAAAVGSVSVTNGGSGYSSGPTVSFSSGGGTGAAATSTLSPTSVASVTLTNDGSGYTSPPTVSISGGGGTGAAATASLAPSAVQTLTLTSGGNGYTSAPTVTISGGDGSGATATATIALANSRNMAWDSNNQLAWVDTNPTATWSDSFDSLDNSAWVYNSYQTIDNGTVKDSGDGVDYNANFYRSISNINGGTTGQGIQVDFKVDGTDNWALISMESNSSPYQRFGLIAASDKIFVQYTNDGVNWTYPADLINPLQLNTWYVASLKISPTGVAMIEVWQKDNPSVRGSYTLQMPAGRSYCFHNWILTGNVWLDNYQEMNIQATTYVYDGDGNRVEKTENGETTVYVNQYYEKNETSGVVTTHYYLGSKQIAVRQGTTLSYIEQDDLGSTTVISDANGNSVGNIQYFPFGLTRSSSGTIPTDEKFTGQRLDGTGLYYYGARYYDPNIGRFISPDTIVPHPMNPQSLNRYSYALNNPLRYIDPTGHEDINGIDSSLLDTYGFDTVMGMLGADSQYQYQTSLAYTSFVMSSYTPSDIPWNSSWSYTSSAPIDQSGTGLSGSTDTSTGVVDSTTNNNAGAVTAPISNTGATSVSNSQTNQVTNPTGSTLSGIQSVDNSTEINNTNNEQKQTGDKDWGKIIGGAALIYAVDTSAAALTAATIGTLPESAPLIPVVEAYDVSFAMPTTVFGALLINEGGGGWSFTNWIQEKANSISNYLHQIQMNLKIP